MDTNEAGLLDQIDKTHEWVSVKDGCCDECAKCGLHRQKDSDGYASFWFDGDLLSATLNEVVAKGCT